MRPAATLPGMAEKNLLSIDDDTFEREVLASKQPFLLDFTAAWCGPCKALAPIVESLAEETAGRLKVGTIDIDEAPEIAQRFRIRSLPTVLVFRDGKEAARHVGVTTSSRLRELAGI
jgi:thioredoxin 1